MSERVSQERVGRYHLEPRIARLIAGVAIAEQLETIPDLEGPDNGLYMLLKQLAVSHGEIVEDRDEVTGDILRDGRKGLRKQFYRGMVIMVKEGSPLDMTATAAHENAHRWAVPKVDEATDALAEVTCEGAAFVGCDYFGLDISARSFPYIAGYNDGNFTPEMIDGIWVASTNLIEGVLRVRQAA